jgi:hypothetical protein
MSAQGVAVSFMFSLLHDVLVAMGLSEISHDMPRAPQGTRNEQS